MSFTEKLRALRAEEGEVSISASLQGGHRQPSVPQGFVCGICGREYEADDEGYAPDGTEGCEEGCGPDATARERAEREEEDESDYE